MNKLTLTSVGADLSGTPPIYRPLGAFHAIQPVYCEYRWLIAPDCSLNNKKVAH